jgi:hypothetical protein
MRQRCHRNDGQALLLRAERNVEDHRVHAGMREQDDRVLGIEMTRAQDRAPVTLDRVDEPVLACAHVTPDAMDEIIVLSTIGRKPTIVPVRGNISSAGDAPWPVPKLNTSLSAAIEAAQACAARSIASA